MNTIRIDKKQVGMIAHRGLSGIERENTYPAFVAAGNRSYFGIETDVHVTKDGKFVILHDKTTERVSLGTVNINVEENNYATVSDVVLPDLDGCFQRQDIRIPLLADYIRICKKYGKTCVLEVKNRFSEADLARMVNEITDEGYLDSVIFISFELDNCTDLRKLAPNNRIQWLIGNKAVTEEIITTLVENSLDLDIHYKALTPQTVALLHAKGIAVNCWTCDDKETAEHLVAMGVDFITTNILE